MASLQRLFQPPPMLENMDSGFQHDMRDGSLFRDNSAGSLVVAE